MASLDVLPTITALRERGEEIVKRVLAENEPRWESLSEQDRERVETLARAVVNRLLHERAEHGLQVELVPIRTSGDERARGPGPAAHGDKSRFVKEIEEALLAEEIDLAVHSAKDVPGELPDGLSIVGVPERADPRDALCGAGSLDDLAEGARVGTSSLRRRAQLLAARPDLR